MSVKPDPSAVALLPTALLKWSGHRGGGVRKPFFEGAGRPCETVIRTPLLERLEGWAADLAARKPGCPRSIFLVGGPGNGKTEAIEQAVRALDRALNLNGKLVGQFTLGFGSASKEGSGRLVSVNVEDDTSEVDAISSITLVQDASMSDSTVPLATAPELFLTDVENILSSQPGLIYLACVNRGILDEALTLSIIQKRDASRRVVEAIIRSIEVAQNTSPCWPLADFPNIATWPMDVESLLTFSSSDILASPAGQVLSQVLDDSKWPAFGTCAAGNKCPFCGSRKILDREGHRESLLQVLRWSELALGKRWSFRDLFSLYSLLFAGASVEEGRDLPPCEWAGHLLRPAEHTSQSQVRRRHKDPFRLTAALYQHALFNFWSRPNARLFKKQIADVGMSDDSGLSGLFQFLTASTEEAITGTLNTQLQALCRALDPALADPDSIVVAGNSTITLGPDLDAYFSQSVADGLNACRKHLHTLEIEVLTKLAESDQRLSSASVRKAFPGTARQLQGLIRDFSCRLVRRSLGVRFGIVRDHGVLVDFQKVVEGDPQLIHKAVKQVESLLNENERFNISLNSTFGEPSLPPSRRATLVTPKQKVKALEAPLDGRPASGVRFLGIGSGKGTHALAMTFELFRAVHDLRSGLLPASLPRPVVALLDTSKSRLAGTVVRDEDALDDAEIRLGTMNLIVRRELGTFVVSRRELP